MSTWLRVIVTASAFVATQFVAAMTLFLILPDGPLIGLPAGIAALLCAIAVAMRTWSSTKEPASGALSSMLRGAAICGGIGFAAGFMGPMIFAPGSNQGPMLGIFITGPAGVVVGAVGGLVRGLVK